MIVLLSPDVPPRLTDADRLDRLHAECAGPPGEMRFDDLCAPADDDHVWLAIPAARAAGSALVDDAGGDDYAARFDGMVAFAASKGWVNEAGTHLRAHVERTDAGS